MNDEEKIKDTLIQAAKLSPVTLAIGTFIIGAVVVVTSPYRAVVDTVQRLKVLGKVHKLAGELRERGKSA